MQPGDIVEFLHGDASRIGVITGEIGTQKFVVKIAGGVELRVPLTDVTLQLASRVDAGDSAAIERRLSLLQARVANMKSQVDLPTLWEVATEAGGSQTIDQLIELMLGEVSDVGRLALVQSMRHDPAFFVEHEGTWTPRSPNVVQDMVAQRQRAGHREAIHERFVQAVASALNAPSHEQPALLASLNADPAHRGMFSIVHDAAAVEDYGEAGQAERLISEIEAVSGRSIVGEGRFKAFQLMRDLGIWGEHQNLMLIRYGVVAQPPPRILELANEAVLPEGWREGREDFTGWYTLTIDDASTQDIDDALSVRPTIDGGWEVAIHIADPSVMVPAGSDLDAWARARGTSIYLPEGTIPMLPDALSEQSISLVQGAERPAVTLQVSYDEALTLTDWRFSASIVRVDRRLTYDAADRMLDSESHDHVSELLGALAYITDETLFERNESGAISIGLPEARLKVELAEDGAHASHIVIGESLSRQLIMELMVLYNRLAARYLNTSGCPAIYRVQDPPDREQLRTISNVPQGYAREFARLKTMRKGEASTYPGRHAGLGIEAYLQATSPIRRYGDVVMQRQIVALTRGEPPPYSDDQLMLVMSDVERAMDESRVITRAGQRYWSIYLLSAVTEPIDAVVLDYKDDVRVRATVLLERFALRTIARLRSHPKVGETVKLAVERTDCRRDVLTFREVE